MQLKITTAQPSILSLEAYPAGKPLEEFKREYGIDDVIKLASNENPLGCSPRVTLAITEQLGTLSRYPDANGYYLKQALADYHDRPIEQFILGNGSEEVINLIGRCFINHQDSVVYSQYSFIAYSLVTKAQGANPIEVPAKNYAIDLDAMLAAVKLNDTVKVVFIANPNNPTGSLLTTEALREFLLQVPEHVLVVLDEAYVDYEPSSDNQALLAEFANLIVLRTFSKAYGLAGVRVGYGMAHPAMIDIFNRVRQPFNVNRLAQAAATAALADQHFVKTVRDTNHNQRAWLYQQFDSLGINFRQSYTSFILVQMDNAFDINQALLKQGIIVRPMDEYGLDNWIRITVGTAEENIRLIDTLKDLLN